ncbi:acetylserotonin O-methyltransferase [Actinomadura rupiterrae]|uniref:acetylserotonin O-methyltransferase n=1 Tax=Actinomadura rupiterrae TaxID=559627 RepID=UPI0020A5545B|nr:acetylserotonin O-methyltransferase [Actinomadura rupiterrae]MCP2337296.1 ubiquinone/menaquinone biosynthesis C-methylase UbiE [Actinomadura rupiterrae]
MSQEQAAATTAPHVQLREICIAHYRFQYLSTAFEFGLFALLSQRPGLARTEIAAGLGLAEQPARILLLGCTAFGMVRKDGDRYYNTELTQSLAHNLDQFPAVFIPFYQHITYRAMGWFGESLKANTNVGLKKEFGAASTNLYSRVAGDPVLEGAFHNAMGALSAHLSDEFVQTLDLSRYRHVLDIGGGTAVNAMNLVRRWPQLQITILDLPSVAKEANERVSAAGLGDRIRALGADALADAFPSGSFDCVLFAHFLEIWSTDRIRAVLRKAAEVVDAGAGIFIVTPFQDDDETGPQNAAELSAYFHAVASGEGMVYTPREFEAWMAEAGFESSGRTFVNNLVDHIVISGVRTDHAVQKDE